MMAQDSCQDTEDIDLIVKNSEVLAGDAGIQMCLIPVVTGWLGRWVEDSEFSSRRPFGSGSARKVVGSPAFHKLFLNWVHDQQRS